VKEENRVPANTQPFKIKLLLKNVKTAAGLSQGQFMLGKSATAGTADTAG
jgi:hypothetical protein